ncbi:pyridoxal phosphate-dependent aminotransferase [Calditrichota bacterium]
MSGQIVPAHRTEHITYAVRDIVLYAKQVERDTGKEMLWLNIGDPNAYDFETPPHIVEAIHKALLNNYNGYSPSSGTDEAVDAIRRSAERKGIRSIRDVFVTTGASEGIDLCLTALANKGENVLIPSPGYPLYDAILHRLQVEPRYYYLDEDNGWQPNLEDIASKIDDNTRAIVLINPNNPTGSNCSTETLQGLIDIVQGHDIVLFADEIYDKMLFDGTRHTSLASLDHEQPIITFNGLSKNYLGPGLRIGWGVVSGDDSRIGTYIEAINKLLRARLCANHPIQFAIKPALEGDQSHIDDMNRRLTARRNLTVSMLNEIDGISCVTPGGAFYAFPQLHIRDDDNDFVRKIIAETGVVVVPGAGFGQVPGTRHFRLVFLPPEETLRTAYEKLADFMHRHRDAIVD